MPWCTYTDPEIAPVGLYEHQVRERGIELDTYVREFKHVDRAVLDGEEDGFVKIHVQKGRDEIVGATIVARHAGEMIEAIRQCGDAYNRTRLTPTVKKWMSRWLAWQRS